MTLCKLADGGQCVVKQAGMGESLENEVRMLAYLRTHSDLPIPEVLGADAAAIVMSCPASGRSVRRFHPGPRRVN